MRRRHVLALLGATALPIAGCIDASDRSPDAGLDGTTAPDPAEREHDPSTLVDTDWPQHGRNARNHAHSPGARGPRGDGTVAWRHDLGTPTMNSSPTVGDGVVYATGTGDPGGLLALDAETGDRRWHVETDGYASGAPTVGDDAVFVGTWGQSLHAFDRLDGTERWTRSIEHRIGGAAPTFVDGTLYVATLGYGPLVVSNEADEEAYERPAVFAVDAATGDELWRYDDFGERDRIVSTPAVADGRVIFSNEGAIHAVDATTGELRWRRSTGSHGDLAPVVVGDHILVGGRGDGATVVALDLDGGDVRWRTPIAANNLRVSPAVADGVAYVAATRYESCPSLADDCDANSWGRLYAVDVGDGDGEVLWEVDLRPDTRSAPAVGDDVVYVGNGNGVTAVSLDGDVRWDLSFAPQGSDHLYLKSSLAIAGERLFVGASDRHLRAIAPPA